MRKILVGISKNEKPNIRLTVRRVEPSVWYSLGFYAHHYLTSKLNPSCKCLLFEWDGVPVAFVGVINQPTKGIPYACSVSRLVVLPDYQGLGLSTRIFNFVGGVVKSLGVKYNEDYRLYIKTAHRKFGEGLGNNENVRGTSFDKKGRNPKNIYTEKYKNKLTRVSYCKEYVGPPIFGYEDLMKPIAEMRKERKEGLAIDKGIEQLKIMNDFFKECIMP